MGLAGGSRRVCPSLYLRLLSGGDSSLLNGALRYVVGRKATAPSLLADGDGDGDEEGTATGPAC